MSTLTVCRLTVQTHFHKAPNYHFTHMQRYMWASESVWYIYALNRSYSRVSAAKLLTIISEQKTCPQDDNCN